MQNVLFQKGSWKDAAFLSQKGRGNESCCLRSGVIQTPQETIGHKGIWKLLLSLLAVPTVMGTAAVQGTWFCWSTTHMALQLLCSYPKGLARCHGGTRHQSHHPVVPPVAHGGARAVSAGADPCPEAQQSSSCFQARNSHSAWLGTVPTSALLRGMRLLLLPFAGPVRGLCCTAGGHVAPGQGPLR